MPLKSASPQQAKFDRIASLFDDIPRPELRRGLAEMLGTPEPLLSKRLNEVGDELLFHFYSDGKMRQDFRRRFQPKGAKGKAAKASHARTNGLPRDSVADTLARTASPRLAAHVIRTTTKS
jgi:hypothetical protein